MHYVNDGWRRCQLLCATTVTTVGAHQSNDSQQSSYQWNGVRCQQEEYVLPDVGDAPVSTAPHTTHHDIAEKEGIKYATPTP